MNWIQDTPRATPGLYVIRNTVTGHRYFGSTRFLRDRFRQHRNRLILGKHINHILQGDWIKYGEDAFTYEVVAVVDKRILLEAENALLPHGEYNIGKVADAPMKGRKPSDEARKRMSESAQRRCQRERAEREAGV